MKTPPETAQGRLRPAATAGQNQDEASTIPRTQVAAEKFALHSPSEPAAQRQAEADSRRGLCGGGGGFGEWSEEVAMLGGGDTRPVVAEPEFHPIADPLDREMDPPISGFLGVLAGIVDQVDQNLLQG